MMSKLLNLAARKRRKQWFNQFSRSGPDRRLGCCLMRINSGRNNKKLSIIGRRMGVGLLTGLYLRLIWGLVPKVSMVKNFG